MPNDTETTHYNVRGTDPTNNECFGVVPTPFQRFDDGALMGDVLLSAFYLAFDFLKPPLQFSAVHRGT